MVFKSRARPKFLVRGVRESALFSVDWETERQQHGKLSTSYQFDVKKNNIRHVGNIFTLTFNVKNCAQNSNFNDNIKGYSVWKR